MESLGNPLAVIERSVDSGPSLLGNASTLMAADAVALAAATLVAFALGFMASPVLTGVTYVEFGIALSARWEVFAVATGIAGIWLHLHGHYTERIPLWTELRDLLWVSLMVLVLEGFLQFVFKVNISRLWILATWTLFPAFAVMLRSAAKRLLTRSGLWLIPTVVFGRPQEATSVAEALISEPMLGFDVVSACEPTSAEQSLSVMRMVGARFAVVAQGDGGEDISIALARAMSRSGIPFAIVPPFAGLSLSGMRSQFIFGHDVLLLMERRGLLRRPAQLFKRSFDLVASIAALIILAPVLAIIALLVRSDGGPVLFGHERIGRNGRPFRCLKFRTMVPDAEARLHDLLNSNADARAEWERDYKLRSDPRLTRWGRTLRRMSLDEIPQIINVLRGDMSLVGPRPLTAPELSRYGDDVALLRQVRPGITGLWQVSGRNDTDFVRRVALDSWYVRNWSFGYDLLIIVLTIPVLISRRGAY